MACIHCHMKFCSKSFNITAKIQVLNIECRIRIKDHIKEVERHAYHFLNARVY